MEKKNADVFILLGQSNAVGHSLAMAEEDVIASPLENVFGLSRDKNQFFDSETLTWEGYRSAGFNLGETQDNTYSVASCLAAKWQAAKDRGEALSDLFIVHIAVGAEGVTAGYMWNPEYEKILIPGKLGSVKIALFPLTLHVLSLVRESICALGYEPRILGLHWRGGENDMGRAGNGTDALPIYRELFGAFREALGTDCPLFLHRLVCDGRADARDPSGKAKLGMNRINDAFEELAREMPLCRVFDVRLYSLWRPDIPDHGVFKSDLVHFTREVNEWVAAEILESAKRECPLPEVNSLR